jgi:hypothetical protein
MFPLPLTLRPPTTLSTLANVGHSVEDGAWHLHLMSTGADVDQHVQWQWSQWARKQWFGHDAWRLEGMVMYLPHTATSGQPYLDKQHNAKQGPDTLLWAFLN